MSEHELPEGSITRDEVAELADLFDRFEFAFDPRSVAAKEAESDFEERIRLLFTARVQPRFPSVSFVAFHCRIKSLCREHLRRNTPQ
jgi:hypothetical protein